tara:strand:+ start:6257 stop:6517 length:261 start_codon:yes stop_codon:yes gene_type:complete
MNKHVELCILDKYEEFTIPSINIKGVLLNHGIGSVSVMYLNDRIENKMSTLVSYKNRKTTISPQTKVIRSGKINSKFQQETEKFEE